MSISERGRFEGVDLLKGICCLAVVFLHCHFPGLIGDAYGFVFKFPVAVFFLISGYFCVNKELPWFLKKAKYILKLIIVSEAFYFVFNGIVSIALGATMLEYLKETFREINVLKSIFFGPLFCGPLWYLYATFWTWIVIWLIKKYWNIDKALILIPILLVLALIGRYIHAFVFEADYVESTIFIFRSAMFYGVPFTLMGAWLYKLINVKKTRISNKTICVLLFSWLLFLVFEFFLTHISMDFQLSTVPLAIAIFCCGIQLESVPLIIKPLVNVGRDLSIYVYIYHISARTIVETFEKCFNIEAKGVVSWVNPIIMMLLTIGMSLLFHMIVSTKKEKQIFK